MNESSLVHDVIQELGKYGAVYRCNAGSIRLPNGKTFRGMPKGFSDIMLVLPGGKAYFIETKVKPNKPSDEQIAFIEKMRRLGCAACLPVAGQAFPETSENAGTAMIWSKAVLSCKQRTLHKTLKPFENQRLQECAETGEQG
jgi:hypothetical protein